MNPLCLAQPTPLVAPETFLIRLYLGKAKPQKLQRPGLLRNVGQRELEESILAPRRTKSPVRFFQYQKPSMLGLSLKGVSRVLGTSPGGGGWGQGRRAHLPGSMDLSIWASRDGAWETLFWIPGGQTSLVWGEAVCP